MTVDVRTLFKIVGEEGSALRRVEEAMEWLLSPKAEGIGEDLLRRMHVVHNKPVTISVSATGLTGYDGLGHVLHINPPHIAGMSLKSADGISHGISIERELGHELQHATESPEIYLPACRRMALLRDLAADKAKQSIPMQQRVKHSMILARVKSARDYETAERHIMQYVDEAALPLVPKVMDALRESEEFAKLLEKIEAPAVAIENRIAALRGEPMRPTDYLIGYDIKPEVDRRLAIDQLAAQFNIQHLPKASINHDPKGNIAWTTSLGDRSGHGLGG